MRPRRTQVSQDVGVIAARLFQRISESGEPVPVQRTRGQLTLLIDLLRKSDYCMAVVVQGDGDAGTVVVDSGHQGADVAGLLLRRHGGAGDSQRRGGVRREACCLPRRVGDETLQAFEDEAFDGGGRDRFGRAGVPAAFLGGETHITP
jgi:hypothetical protein